MLGDLNVCSYLILIGTLQGWINSPLGRQCYKVLETKDLVCISRYHSLVEYLGKIT